MLNYFDVRLLIIKTFSKLVALPKISLEKYLTYYHPSILIKESTLYKSLSRIHTALR